jgi:hypothetical protein
MQGIQQRRLQHIVFKMAATRIHTAAKLDIPFFKMLRAAKIFITSRGSISAALAAFDKKIVISVLKMESTDIRSYSNRQNYTD